MARVAMGEPKIEIDAEGNYEKEENFLKRYKIEQLENLIARRKAVWLGHATRGKDDFSLGVFEKAKEENDEWWKSLTSEMGKFNTTPEEVMGMADNPASIKSLFDNEYMIRRDGRGRNHNNRAQPAQEQPTRTIECSYRRYGCRLRFFTEEERATHETTRCVHRPGRYML